MKKWQAIIFDLDDTLYAEREYVISGFREVAKKIASILSFNEESGFKELRQLFESGVRGDTFNRWLKLHGIESPEIVSLCIEAYRNHIPIISPFPEVNNILSRLKSSLKIGLVSDGYLEVQKRKWAVLGLEKYFDAVVFSDELGRDAWKPSTRPFEEILRKLNCHPVNSIYVGDNCTKDFFAPRFLGMRSIRIKRPDGEYAHIEPLSIESEPDVTINTLFELNDALES